MPHHKQKAFDILKRISTLHWLFIIFLCTAMIEVYNATTHGLSDKPIVRIFLLGFLFRLTIKRVQWARYVLATLYMLGGVIGLGAFSSNASNANTWIIGVFGLFCFVVAVFLLRSKALGKPLGTPQKAGSIGLEL